MAEFFSNSIFWVDIDKVKPNPYQPRKQFEEGPLRDLADSIRQYGIMQPLTVSRKESEKPEGGIVTEYELIAGERRLRASKLAGLAQVPVIIRLGDDPQEKLELAILENLQREDLNPVDRARAFSRLAQEFNLQHNEIGKKIGRSREYVSNTLRMLALPEEILNAVAEGKITEGHTRPLLMLSDRPEEQTVLFKEIVTKKVNVRDAEKAARSIAVERARKPAREPDPEIVELEGKLQEVLGERAHIEQEAVGGRVTISYLTAEELKVLLDRLYAVQVAAEGAVELTPVTPEPVDAYSDPLSEVSASLEMPPAPEESLNTAPVEKKDDSDLYSISNFSI